MGESLLTKINVNEKDELLIKGFRPHLGRSIVTVFAIVLSFGLLLILLVWRKDIKLSLFYQECPLHLATKVLLKVIRYIIYTLIVLEKELYFY